MYFLGTGTTTKPAELAAYTEKETAILNQLRTEGTVKTAFRYATKRGVIGISQNASLAGLKAELDRLPLISQGLMTFDYDEIIEL